ncbi:hypothetical protein ZIOFF_040958 [Zingiber officinale]|uniref:Uncharacterized protein n=1 Tax=Zingiber officinale TaxID=94328 RepID=A0A8J5G5W6_ZINOF|nr:hypothetical protein ZIOFF_040958 [Zingiber officinale]
MERSVNSGTAPPEATSDSSSPQLKIADLLILIRGITAARRPRIAIPLSGSGKEGKLCMGDWEEKDWAHRIQFLFGVKIVQDAIGGWHCLAVDNQGRAYAWGIRKMEKLLQDEKSDKRNLLEIDRPKVDKSDQMVQNKIIIAGGGRHSAAPTDDGEYRRIGKLYEWRRGKHGRLGLGDDKSSKMVSQKVPTPGGNKHCPGILLRHSFSGIDYRWTNFLGTCKI